MYTYDIPQHCVAALSPAVVELDATIRLRQFTLTILLTQAIIKCDKKLNSTQLSDVHSMLSSLALYL